MGTFVLRLLLPGFLLRVALVLPDRGYCRYGQAARRHERQGNKQAKGGKVRMNIAVICEFSGTVRDSFTSAGHNAISFDLLPSETPGKHIRKDIRLIDKDYWSQFDLAICHPPCTHLSISGARWFKEKVEEQKEALQFVQFLMDLPIPHIAIENPISIISSRIRKPDQIIHPWQYGHGETKATCLWLKNLPGLIPTNIVGGRESKIHRMAPGPDRWKERSRTYKGIAQAMSEQWGAIYENSGQAQM
jgi:site-specific DNA-cytosine methylase